MLIIQLLVLHFSKFGRLKILPVVSSVVASSEVDDGVVVSMAYDTVTTRQKTRPNHVSRKYRIKNKVLILVSI